MRTFEQRFPLDAPRRRSEYLRELPSATVVMFRDLAYVKSPNGTWEGGFRALTDHELSAAIASSDWQAVTD